jgi:hypothetical protein
MTVAAIDRLVHRAAIFEMNVESYRRRSAASRKAGKPIEHVTAQPSRSSRYTQLAAPSWNGVEVDPLPWTVCG